MDETTLPDSTQSPSSSRQERPLKDIRDDIDAAEGQRQQVFERFDVSNLDFEGLDATLKELRPDLHQLYTDPEVYKLPEADWDELLTEIRTVAGEDRFSPIEAYARAYREVSNKLERLYDEASEPARRELEQKWQWFVAHVDWRKLVEAKVQGSVPGGVAHYDPHYALMRAAGLKPKAGQSGYDLILYLDDVDQATEMLQASEWLFESEYSEEELEMMRAPDIGGAMVEWRQDTLEAINFVLSERRSSLMERFLLLMEHDTPWSRLEQLARNFGMHQNDYGWHLPRIIVDEVKQRFSAMTTSFDMSDEAAIMESYAVRPNVVIATGEDRLLATTTIANPSKWTMRMLRRLPTRFYAGLGRIEYVDDIENNRRDVNADSGDNPGASEGGEKPARKIWHTVGDFWLQSNKVRVSVRRSFFDSQLTMLTKPGDDKETQEANARAENAVRGDITDTIRLSIYHEVAHYGMRHTVPIALLRQWLRVCKDEVVNVTSYVTRYREEETKRDADDEDFAESVGLYMSEPDTLFWDAPRRFLFCNRLLGRYSDETISAATRLMKDVARGKADIREANRSIYLLFTLGAVDGFL